MVRKRKDHPRSVVKIIEIHPKHLRLISTVTTCVWISKHSQVCASYDYCSYIVVLFIIIYKQQFLQSDWLGTCQLIPKLLNNWASEERNTTQRATNILARSAFVIWEPVATTVSANFCVFRLVETKLYLLSTDHGVCFADFAIRTGWNGWCSIKRPW